MATYHEIASFVLFGLSSSFISSGLNSNFDDPLTAAKERGARERKREADRQTETDKI
jgi:hypothetical protein